jgi:hypothetical protein
MLAKTSPHQSIVIDLNTTTAGRRRIESQPGFRPFKRVSTTSALEVDDMVDNVFDDVPADVVPDDVDGNGSAGHTSPGKSLEQIFWQD